MYFAIVDRREVQQTADSTKKATTSSKLWGHLPLDMGKKKSRQSGQFSSKSKRAAHLSELNDTVSEVRKKDPKRTSKASNNSVSNGNYNLYLSTRSLVGQRQVLMSMQRIRGLLRERLLEDRELEWNFRQQQWGLYRPSKSNESRNCNTKQECTPTGWILSYEHRKYLAGIRECDEKKSIVPSLEDLCLKGFASALKDYILFWQRFYEP